jgi:hypothetical protein
MQHDARDEKKIHVHAFTAHTLTPSPTLPRMRGRERTAFAARLHIDVF